MNSFDPESSDSQQVVVGPGAVGVALAAALSTNGPVCLVGRNHPGKIEQQSYTCELPGGTAATFLAQFVGGISKLASLPEAAVVWIAVKTDVLPSVLVELKTKLNTDTIVVLLGNGLGLMAQARKILGYHQPLVRAVVLFGAYRRTDQTVVQVGEISIAVAASREIDWSEHIEWVLESAGIYAQSVDSETELEWNKIALNASINIMAAVHDCPNGGILERPEFMAQSRRILAEVKTIAQAEGVQIRADIEAVHQKILVETGKNICSTLADLRKGARGEARALFEPLLSIADRHALAAPELRAVWAAFLDVAG